MLQQQLHGFLKDDPLPHAVIVTGRGALMDGLVECLGQMIELKATLGRSRRAQRTGDLATQVGLTPAIGASTSRVGISTVPIRQEVRRSICTAPGWYSWVLTASPAVCTILARDGASGASHFVYLAAATGQEAVS